MLGRHTKQFYKRKKIILQQKGTQWSLFIIQMRRFGMRAPWFHTFQYFFHFFLFRPPSYLHKLQPSAWNHEEIGKFIWKYIELFDSMKNDNSYHALEFVQIKCDLIMILT